MNYDRTERNKWRKWKVPVKERKKERKKKRKKKEEEKDEEKNEKKGNGI